jgi:hypothetical protein
VGRKVVQAGAVLGTSPREFKQVPKGTDACILFACWATAAEMIVKHRNSSAKFTASWSSAVRTTSCTTATPGR